MSQLQLNLSQVQYPIRRNLSLSDLRSAICSLTQQDFYVREIKAKLQQFGKIELPCESGLLIVSMTNLPGRCDISLKPNTISEQ